MTTSRIVVPYKTASGMAQKEFTVYRTHHGPIVREADGKWVSIRLMQEPVKALNAVVYAHEGEELQGLPRHDGAAHQLVEQHHLRRRRRHDRLLPLQLHSRSAIRSSTGRSRWTAAIPRRNGTACCRIDETPGLKNPPNGWLYNTNNQPWSAAGPNSPKKSDYPAYVDKERRERHAASTRSSVLGASKDFTLDSLVTTAYDSYQPGFAEQIPALVKAYDALPASNALKAKLSEQIGVLKGWDFRWSATSVANSLAVYWSEEIGRRVNADARKAGISADEYMR